MGTLPRLRRLRAPWMLLIVVVCGCVPYMNPTASDIPKLGSLKDVMAAQETITDPVWSKIDDRSYGDADWLALEDVSVRIRATAERSMAWSRGKLFDHYDDALRTAAVDLGSAVDQKSADLAAQALTDMRHACRSCHEHVR